MKIAVVGTGYVGLVSGACFSSIGHNVICVDNNQTKIDNLNNNGIIPIYEPGLENLVKENVKAQKLSFTTNLDYAVKNSDVIFIAVGTPPRPDNGQADLKYVYQVAQEIANSMDSFKVIVDKSTVPIGTADEVTNIIKNITKNDNFAVVSNPEFLREGSAIDDFLYGDRVVIGAENKQAEELMRKLYQPLEKNNVDIVITKVKTAEMIKYASNTFLAVKLGFINEIADLCEKIGGDVQDVAYAMGLDTRIGAKFLQAGPGFGGSCFPKDTKALKYIASQNNCELSIVNATIESNLNRKKVMAKKIENILDGDLANKNIAVLGLAFKANTDDCRESPSIDIINELLNKNANITAFDPVAMHEAKSILTNINYAENEYDACKNADALLILTEWAQFANLDLNKIKTNLKNPVIIDLRNLYELKTFENTGIAYHSVGR
jgi:UDPglucose 6-dehydrogenase